MEDNSRKLTILEATALGIIWKRKGCSAYDVMVEFSSSLAAQFKSRAGSVYPLIKRLASDGLIEGRDAKRGNQSKSIYKITPTGRKLLGGWLSDPVSSAESGLLADPIRTRIYFLGILPPAKRQAFLDAAAAQMKLQLESAKVAMREFQDDGNTFAVLAMKGALRITRARIAWLAEIRDEID